VNVVGAPGAGAGGGGGPPLRPPLLPGGARGLTSCAARRNLKSEHKQVAKEMEAVSTTLAGARALVRVRPGCLARRASLRCRRPAWLAGAQGCAARRC